MSGLRFACSYRPINPRAEWTCDRPAAQRERGTSKCLGHWVVEWINNAHGGIDRGRSTWSVVYWLAFCFVAGRLVDLVWKAFQGKLPEHAVVNAADSIMVAGFIGGVLIALALERASGGTLFLVFAPLAFVATIARGLTQIPGHDAPPITATGQLNLLGTFAWAAVIVALWLNFVLYFLERHYWATRMNLLMEVGLAALAVAAVAVAITSRGQQSIALIWFVAVFGVMVVLRGATRIAKLIRRLRV